MSHPAPLLEIAMETDADGAVRAAVLDNLRRFNRQRAESPNFAPVIVAARQDGQLIGGLVGETGWRWLFVELLWVAEQHRGRGVGRRLLDAAEAEAVRRGARHAYLDTFDFQARPFYERAGYEVFGTLDDYPPGHCRYFLRKDLGGGEESAAMSREALR